MLLRTLIASHIDSAKRLNNFVKLINSINEQIDYHDKIEVEISLSHDDNITYYEINYILGTVNKNNFKIHYQDKKFCQFEHYKFLISQIVSDVNDTWILFSDDDDEWEENRLAAYHYMINCIEENMDDYNITTSICYTNEEQKTSANYVGSYTDYCIKLKYLKIFFKTIMDIQLQHKFCDCYFVKFICSYGKGKLKRAFCATDDILYHWIKRTYNENKEKPNIKDVLGDNLDLFIAQYSNPTAQKWMKFCDIYSNGKISNDEVSPELKKYMIKLYMENYENHIFADKNMPVYSED